MVIPKQVLLRANDGMIQMDSPSTLCYPRFEGSVLVPNVRHENGFRMGLFHSARAHKRLLFGHWLYTEFYNTESLIHLRYAFNNTVVNIMFHKEDMKVLVSGDQLYRSVTMFPSLWHHITVSKWAGSRNTKLIIRNGHSLGVIHEVVISENVPSSCPGDCHVQLSASDWGAVTWIDEFTMWDRPEQPSLQDAGWYLRDHYYRGQWIKSEQEVMTW